jgi:hypothetical protein
MITFFRKHRKGVVGAFIVGLCAVLMLPFGFEYFGGPSVKTYVAKVGSEEIPVRSYINEVRRTEALYRSQFGEQYEALAGILNIRERVLDDIIDRTLLSQLYSKTGIAVSFSQVEKYAMGLPIFEGGADRATFESFLKNTGMSESEFEQKIKEQLMEDSVGSLLEMSAVVSTDELQKRYSLVKTRIGVSYSKVTPSAELIETLSVPEERMQAYYEENKTGFYSDALYYPLLPRFPPSSFFSKVMIHEEDVVDLYRRKFHGTDTSLEEVRADLEKELKESIAPEYAKVAAEEFISKLIQGSDRERMDRIREITSRDSSIELLEPEDPVSMRTEVSYLSRDLQSEILQMKRGGVRLFFDGSTPVVVFMKDITDPSQRPFHEVKGDIERILKDELINAKSKEIASGIIDDLKESDSDNFFSTFTARVKMAGLKVEDIAPETIQKISIPFISNPQDTQTFVSTLIEKQIIDEPYLSLDGNYYILSLRSVETPQEPAEEELRTFFQEEKSFSKGRGFQTLLTKLKMGTDITVNHEFLE